MASTAGKLPKPNLRNILINQLKLSIPACLVGGLIGSAYIYKVGLLDTRRTFEEFYKTYDVEADYKRMKKLGVFKSVPTNGPFRDPEAADLPESPIETSDYIDEIESLVKKYKNQVKADFYKSN